jgi:hypothetical protein
MTSSYGGWYPVAILGMTSTETTPTQLTLTGDWVYSRGNIPQYQVITSPFSAVVLQFCTQSQTTVLPVRTKTSVFLKEIINSNRWLHMISGFRRDADDICDLLGYYAASSGKSLPTLRDNVSVPSSKGHENFLEFLSLEDRTDTLSRNIGKELPLDAA